MRKQTQIIITLVGIALICIGMFMPVPSKELTTYSFMANEGYSVIEEYVGGDAYNYIIGAALVGGEIAGAKAQKAIYTVTGLFFICTGMILSDFRKQSDTTQEKRVVTGGNPSENTFDSSVVQEGENC